jgi:hypothetical protein
MRSKGRRLSALPKSGLIMFAGWRDITPKMRSRVRGVLRDWQWHKKPFEDTPYWSKRFAPYEEVFAHTRPPHPVTLYRSERTDIDNRYGDRFTSWSRVPSAVENFGWGSRRMVEATFQPEDILVDFLNVDLDSEGMQEVIVRPGKYDVKPWDKWAMFRRPSQPKLGAFTSNADLDKFKYRITKKQDGHVLRVYDGKTMIGAVGAITKGCDYPGIESHGSVVVAEILPEYRGRKLYQEMLLRLNDYVKKMGCKGLKSKGFQRSSMADRAWRKLNPRVVPDKDRPTETREDVLFLDGLPKSGRIPLDTAKRAMKRLPAKTRACGFSPAALREGMEIEREHRDVTKGRVLDTAKVAAAHLCERPDYYKRLKRYVER